MCSVAPAAALGFDATAFLHRRRGVAAVTPAACGVMAREPVRRVGAVVSSAPPTQKRSRDGFDGKIRDREGSAPGEVSIVPAPGQQRLQERMRAELDAVRDLHRKAVLLCRGAGRSGAAPAAKGDAQFSAAGPRREAPLEAAAKRRKTCPLESATEPAHQKQAVKQQPPVQRAAPPSAEEVLKRRRLEEMAHAREKCREEVLEMERTALPDETIYPRDLEELGIAFQYAVTRTRSQALSQDLPQ